MIKFHFQRFEFVLLQLWLILLTFLVCFASNQCPLITSECNAMSALQTSFNLPTSFTNLGNQTNPCSKKSKKKTRTKKHIPKQDKTNHFIQFFFQRKFKKLFYFYYVKNEQHNFYLVFIFDSLARSDLQFYINSNNSNQLGWMESEWNNSNSNWIDDFIAIPVRWKKKEKKKWTTHKNLFLFFLFFPSFLFLNLSVILVGVLTAIWMEQFQLKLDWWIQWQLC